VPEPVQGTVPIGGLRRHRVLQYPDGQIVGVTNGTGLMARYRRPFLPANRWAIVA
jgi:hypothetical protein